MINRALIRLKVIQIIYAYYQNGSGKTASADRELAKSIESAYSLYKTLLYIPVAWSVMARKSVARQQRMNAPHISRKELLLSQNNYLLQFESNATIAAYIQDNDLSWLYESDWIKETYQLLLQSDIMEEYIQNETFDFKADRELIRKLYKKFVESGEENQTSLDSLLEEQNIYWNGDKDLLDSFVLKTIRSYSEEKADSPLLNSEFDEEEYRQYALELLHDGLDTVSERERVVAANCRRWDPSRLAFMDVIIIQVAIAELLHFNQIPINVTINEYVEIAKLLSTPSSGSFVNGMLDTIAKSYLAEGRITKQ